MTGSEGTLKLDQGRGIFRQAVSFALVLLCSVAFAVPARAQVIYLNPAAGDDSFDGSSRRPMGGGRGPVRSLRRALELASPGATIRLVNSDVPYVAGLASDKPGRGGTPGQPVVIDGDGAVLLGRMKLPPDVWRYMGNGIYRMQPFRKGYYQLFLDGKPAEFTDYRPDPENPEIPALKPLQWTVRDGQVYFRVKPNSFINDYALEYPGVGVGLDLFGVSHVVVRNLTAEGFYLDGIVVHGDSRDVRIESATLRYNARAGLGVGGTSLVAVVGTRFLDNRFCDLYTYGIPRVNLLRCQLQGGGDYIVSARGGTVRLIDCLLGRYRRGRFEELDGMVQVVRGETTGSGGDGKGN